MPDFDTEPIASRNAELLRVKLVLGALDTDGGDISSTNPLPTVVGVPAVAAIFTGANNGTAAQTVTDITGVAAITANKVFSGFVAIQAWATQNAAIAAAGSVIVAITWVPGTDGTTARRVATINLAFGVGAVTSLTSASIGDVIVVPVQLYVGTTVGKFQATVTVAGTVSTILWDVIVSGRVD